MPHSQREETLLKESQMSNERNSNHVLKHPSDHSDLFRGGNWKPVKSTMQPTSQIGACFQMEECKPVTNKPKDQIDSQDVVDENKQPVVSVQPEAKPRVRVPPGGFSSKLW